MRATICFFATLLILGTIASSSISPSELDTQLLEFSKHPSSDAIFATMSMQLTGNGGFNRVLALLNELVHDGKGQLHDMNKVFRAVDARCHVSARHYEMSAEFFSHTLAASKHIVNNAGERLAQVKDMASANADSSKAYAALLKRVLSEGAKDLAGLRALLKNIQKAVKGTKGAQAAVRNWNAKSAALIQANMRDIKTGFVQIHKYDLAEPTTLLEEAGRDEKVKARLAQWLSALKVKFMTNEQSLAAYIKSRTTALATTRGHIGALLNSLKAAAGRLQKSVVWCIQQIKHAKALVSLNAGLLKQNAGLMAANKKYCAAERLNYHTNQVKVTGEIKLFVEIRKYFIDHYSKINSFIKAKYHN